MSAAIVLGAAAAIGLIRAAHSFRKTGSVVVRHIGIRDSVALGSAVAGFIIPIIWVFSNLLAMADFDSVDAIVYLGVAIQTVALYLFHRAHADLGPNWSSNVQLFESHQLVTRGVYARVRHPMYLALILFGLGQALIVPNWIAGPACLAGTALLYMLRVTPEEEMLRRQFGVKYAEYEARTGRLFPRV